MNLDDYNNYGDLAPGSRQTRNLVSIYRNLLSDNAAETYEPIQNGTLEAPPRDFSFFGKQGFNVPNAASAASVFADLGTNGVPEDTFIGLPNKLSVPVSGATPVRNTPRPAPPPRTWRDDIDDFNRDADKVFTGIMGPAAAPLKALGRGIASFSPGADIRDMVDGSRDVTDGIVSLDSGKLVDGAAAITGGLLGTLLPGNYSGIKKSLNEVSDAAQAGYRKQLQQMPRVARIAKWSETIQGAGDNGPGIRRHFADHGADVGAKTLREYNLSARRTIQRAMEDGKVFHYRDRTTRKPRVGFYDPTNEFFTATTIRNGKVTIHTHYPPDKGFDELKELPGFHYR